MATPSQTVRDLLGWKDPAKLAFMGLVFGGAIMGSLAVYVTLSLYQRVRRGL